VVLRVAHHSGSVVAKKASDLERIRIRAASDEDKTDPLVMRHPRYALENRLVRSQAPHWAAGFPVDRSCDAALHIFGSASDSCWDHDHMAHHVLRSCTDSISRACAGREAYPSVAAAQVFVMVLQIPAWEHDGHSDDNLRT
jgi:hypothetical protein